MATSLERSQPASAAARIGFGDILGDGFYSGAVGAAVVALFFLVLDTVRHEPFYTPSLMAGALLGGTAPAAGAPVNLGLVALFTLAHGGAFIAFGIACAWVLARLPRPPEPPLVALACFLGLELSFLVAARILVPGVGGEIGHGAIAGANALAAVGMAVWLSRFARHPEAPAES